MKFKQLKLTDSLSKKSEVQFFLAYLKALEEKPIEGKLVERINVAIDEINDEVDDESIFISKLKKGRSKIMGMVEKEAKLVPIGYYQKRWLVWGMAVFGIPFGLMFGIALDNMAFFGIGIPFGLSIGLAMGTGQDENAKNEGRQLNVKLGN